MIVERAQEDAVVIKIMTQADWDAAVSAGHYAGSPDDARDGFIHLSTPDQVSRTLAKHYAGQSDLLALAYRASDLGPALKWEVSRGGDLFPHLYGPLPTAPVRRIIEIGVDDAGTFVVPGMETV